MTNKEVIETKLKNAMLEIGIDGNAYYDKDKNELTFNSKGITVGCKLTKKRTVDDFVKVAKARFKDFYEHIDEIKNKKATV